jgi:FMN phosphatase YigB (HAD superfamily)
LTNNFSKVDIPPKELEFLGWGDGATPNHLRELFDDFCDSSDLGMRFVELTISRLWRESLIKIKIRKPEHGFYLLACERNGIKPSEAIFLDDIGM